MIMARSTSRPRARKENARPRVVSRRVRSRAHPESPESDDPTPGPRAFASATITFGLVTVPVRLVSANRPSAGIAFHLLHAKDHVRVRQQLVCPKEGKVVPRQSLQQPRRRAAS